MKLFSENSDLYDHDTSTLQTDGRTDNLPWQCRALRDIARQKRIIELICYPIAEYFVTNAFNIMYSCVQRRQDHCREEQTWYGNFTFVNFTFTALLTVRLLTDNFISNCYFYDA